MTGSQMPPPQLHRHIVLEVASAELGDGLWQWPATRQLLAARLGPTALVVPEEKVDQLHQRLQEAGITLTEKVPERQD
jgi:hypothetical protein